MSQLATAIDTLEEEDLSRQTEQQGLKSLLARAYLLAGMDTATAARLAEQSVAQEPGSSARRWILADAYSELGDFEEACNERERAMQLGSGYETLTNLAVLNRIARDYLLLAGSRNLHASEARLRRGLRFFERVLRIVESRRPSRTPMKCIAHAAAHFWLGKFHCELGETEAGLDHLRIARMMKFRPAELALEMGNRYSYKRDYDEAERAFLESLRASRRKNPEPPLADSEPLEPLEVEALLSLAMLWTERGIRLQQAERLCRHAGKRLAAIKGERRRDLRALQSECLGWIFFQNGSIEGSRQELERAAQLSGAQSIQWRLAKVYDSAKESEKAAVARARASANGNGHRKGVFDLSLLSPIGSQPAAVSPS